MKIHRFKTNFKSQEGKTLLENSETVFQIQKVLRLKPGENIILTDGKGTEAHALITQFLKGAVEVDIQHIEHTEKSGPTLHAYIAILKKDNLELAVQKMTEVGITDITPILTDRTVKKNYSAERLEKIITEAIEQSGQSIAPTLHRELALSEALTQARENVDTVVIFDQPGNETTVDFKNKSIAFFIGPEGGWSPNEVELFKKEEITSLSLGDTTLRGETAAIVGAFYIKERQ